LDPDGDALAFEWFHYRDVVQEMSRPVVDSLVSKNITIVPMNGDGSVVGVTPLVNLVSFFFSFPFLPLLSGRWKEQVLANKSQTMHIILSVTEKREMETTTHRRVILDPEA